MPPAVNVTTGSRPCSATHRTSSTGARSSFASANSSSARERLQPPDPAEDRPHVRDRVDDVARARLALRPDHRRALGDPPQRLAEVRRAADERDRELPLVDVVRDVGRGQHLGLVDVVDLERLEDLRLDEVADPALGHHRDRHGLLDRADHLRVGHARDAALHADVGRHALERHHRDRAGVLGDPRLLGGDDVHDHAALQHLGEPALDAHGADLGHAPSVSGGRGAPALPPARSSSAQAVSH